MTSADFDERFLKERRALLRFVQGLTKDYEEAEDIVQECYAKLRSRAHPYEELGYFRAWIRTCCYHEFLDRRRRQEREGQTHNNDGENGNGEVSKETFPYRFSGIHPSSFRLLERLFPSFKLFLERVSHCFLAHVPDHFRAVLELMIKLDISMSEAADRLGLPSKRTDNDLRYQLRKLRSVLFDCICAGGIIPFK